MLTGDVWGIAAATLLWAAGLTAILVTTAPEGTRALRRWATGPRRQMDPRGSFGHLPGADGDVVDSRPVRAASAWTNPSEPTDAGLLESVRVGAAMRGANTPQQAIDPLAQQAATLLAKAMVTSHDRDFLWRRFHELVDATAAELEEAPVRDAIDEFERLGLSLDVVARVVQQRLNE
jgi:hypothetical protein